MKANLKLCFETLRRKVLVSGMLLFVLCLSFSRDWCIPIQTKAGLDFLFLQDRKELDDRLAHTNMDVYECLIPEGLMQSSVVITTFVYHTAMRDELLPRITPVSLS